MHHRLALVALLALGLPALTACGPTPEDACDHVIELMQAELDAQGTKLADDKVGGIRTKCIERASQTKQAKGALEYKKEAQCVVEAESLDAVAACSSP